MNVLILGSGGREHAFASKISKSNNLSKLFIAPGNSGTMKLGKNLNIDINDFDAVKDVVLSNKIEMLVVGPEDPLVKGIHDFFKSEDSLKKVIVIGPKKKAAQLEGSKDFAKQFLFKHKIPTANYSTFTKENYEDGLVFLETLNPPYVLKADGLAAGKGVLIIESLDKAKAQLKQMLLENKFGKASSKVVVEEFLDGIELSCFVLTDGKNYKILPTAKDYKRIGEADSGLNTGGMGAISPVPFADSKLLSKIKNQIIVPTINGLLKDKIEYQGFIFIGLINVNGQPKVIEYNVRMGDPETEAVLPRIKNDLLEIFKTFKDNNLNSINLNIDERTAATVVLVSGGYPEKYQKNLQIHGLNDVKNSLVFHAGSKYENGNIYTNGGRVLAITSLDQNLELALKSSYESASKISFEGMYYRKDIGFDL
jgi:phosphoribosylamine--glycine ligase